MEAVAVCLLWSVVNGSHERRVGEIVKGAWPEVPVTLSHRLNPIAREYRRTVSAVIDAALRPVVSAYVHALDRSLRESGYGNELMIANCLGGMMPPDEIAERPIYSVMSGPTLAPVAARRLTDAPDLVVVDMGGTSFDVSAVRDGQLVISPEAMLTEFDMLGIPKVDVRSVGAGGGSIAHVDAGGLLRVGPESAGADPGPACYGLGGMRPTVTDADVVLGIIDPDYFLGGRMRLDKGGGGEGRRHHRRCARHRACRRGPRHREHGGSHHDRRHRGHHRAGGDRPARELLRRRRRRHRHAHGADGAGARHQGLHGAQVLSRT